MPTKAELEARVKALEAEVKDLKCDFHWEKMTHNFCKKELEKRTGQGEANKLRATNIKKLMNALYGEFRSTGMNKTKARNAANEKAFETGLIKSKRSERWLSNELKDYLYRDEFFEATGIWHDY